MSEGRVLRWGKHPGLFRRAQCNHRVVRKGRRITGRGDVTLEAEGRDVNTDWGPPARNTAGLSMLEKAKQSSPEPPGRRQPRSDFERVLILDV